MKTTLITLCIVAATFSANAQKVKEAEVPSAVKAKQTSLYPNAKVERWEKEDGNFEAEFDNGKVESSTLFDASGKLLETETEIAVSAFPAGVSEYVTKNYAGQKIKEASKIDANGTITYEAEVKEGDLIFDSNGKFLSKKVEKDEDKDDEKKEKK